MECIQFLYLSRFILNFPWTSLNEESCLYIYNVIEIDSLQNLQSNYDNNLHERKINVYILFLMFLKFLPN